MNGQAVPPDDQNHSHAHEGAGHEEPKAFQRDVFGTRLGFILAAVGSAVGLGNMWRFPYATSKSGGAAFVVLYIGMVFLVGIPVMLAEFSVGRGTRLSPIGALRKAGGRGWSPLGWLFVAAGFLILSYYSVIAGWVLRYLVDAIFVGFPTDLASYFGEVTSGIQPIVYHLIFMGLTVAIVMGGIEKGIERASFFMMPTLFLTVVGLAIWAATLDGAGAGYAFYLHTDFAAILDPKVLADAAAQAFFSLSLGMGAMLTFSSYLSKHENLPRESSIISFADFGVAFLAGLVVFPVVFALGLQDEVTNTSSAIGALFISIPGAFIKMGAVGRVVGALFFTVLFVGALTSAISLLEVVTASLIDEFGVARKKAAVGMGVIIALLGILPAESLGSLDAMDGLASGVFLPLGGLALAVLVGWVMKAPLDEVKRGIGPRLSRILPAWLWILRILVPAALAIVLWQTVPEAWQKLVSLFGGG